MGNDKCYFCGTPALTLTERIKEILKLAYVTLSFQKTGCVIVVAIVIWILVATFLGQ